MNNENEKSLCSRADVSVPGNCAILSFYMALHFIANRLSQL
jgi:hypothetical protein